MLYQPAGSPPRSAATSRLLREFVLKPAILAVAILAVVGIVSASPLRGFFGTENVAAFRIWIRGFALWAPTVFFLAAAFGVAAGLPRLFFACVGGATFGVMVGVALAQMSTVLGSAITFAYARWLGRDFVARRLQGRLKALRAPLEFVGRHGVAANVLLRALPVGNCFVTNLLMSLTVMSLGQFLTGTFIGTLPETVIYALFGSSLSGGGAGHSAAAALLLLLVSLGAFLVIWRSRFAGSLGEDATAEPAEERTR